MPGRAQKDFNLRPAEISADANRDTGAWVTDQPGPPHLEEKQKPANVQPISTQPSSPVGIKPTARGRKRQQARRQLEEADNQRSKGATEQLQLYLCPTYAAKGSVRPAWAVLRILEMGWCK